VIVCIALPRFELVVAAGGRRDLLSGPVALAPELGRAQLIGEVSPAAEAQGVEPGLRLGEALARCPRLVLLPPDPAGVADAWERVLVRLESTGAAVESLRPGLACFDAQGLRRLHGGHVDGVVAAVRDALRSRPVRVGLGPVRFCAVAAASRARARRAAEVRGADDLAPLPVELLRTRDELVALPAPLRRLGIDTLGALAGLPRAAVGERFGTPGLQAHDLARGRDTPLRPRRPDMTLAETLELEESSSGEQLQRAMGLLVDRVLARPDRDGRTLRAAVLSARLVEGGTWRERVVFREATANADRIRLALGGRLELLPAPAEKLRLTVERFGPPASAGPSLLRDDASRRRARLREAVGQVRAVAGAEGALRVLEIDPDSRVVERRTVLTPFELP
jgi:protein ImuB